MQRESDLMLCAAAFEAGSLSLQGEVCHIVGYQPGAVASTLKNEILVDVCGITPANPEKAGY